jgi:methylmalonyl-CoA mutase
METKKSLNSGVDYNDTLIWNSPEDIKVKPFYHSDDFTASFEAKQ